MSSVINKFPCFRVMSRMLHFWSSYGRMVIGHSTTIDEGNTTTKLCILLDHFLRLVWNSKLGPVQYPIRRLIVISHEVLNCLFWSITSLWNLQAHRQPCCRGACKILKRLDNIRHKSRGFETSRDLQKDVLSDNETLPQNKSVKMCRQCIAMVASVIEVWAEFAQFTINKTIYHSASWHLFLVIHVENTDMYFYSTQARVI